MFVEFPSERYFEQGRVYNLVSYCRLLEESYNFDNYDFPIARYSRY